MIDQDNINSNPENGAGDDFFEQLEDSVNSGIQEPTQATPVETSGPIAETHNIEQQGTDNNVDWEKRYKDSTREAQKMHSELTNLKPFVPVLEAMKEDSGLVQHVRDYFEGGGAPAKSVKERLGLDEDFMYNEQEAISNPESDSAKVFDAHVNTVVNSKVSNILQGERKKAVNMQRQIKAKQEEEAFKKEHKMSEEQYADLVEKAKKHILTLEDIHYLVNRDQNNTNVANSTKKDMINQMKNARNLPTSAGGTNSQGSSKNFEDDIFDALIGSDGMVDDLFS